MRNKMHSLFRNSGAFHCNAQPGRLPGRPRAPSTRASAPPATQLHTITTTPSQKTQIYRTSSITATHRTPRINTTTQKLSHEPTSALPEQYTMTTGNDSFVNATNWNAIAVGCFGGINWIYACLGIGVLIIIICLTVAIRCRKR